MPWQLPSVEHKVYARNPLIAVIVDLRFQPILRIQRGVADFQDAVRPRFAGYQPSKAQTVQMQPFGPIRVEDETIHRFLGDQYAISLTNQSLTLEMQAHDSKDGSFELFEFGLRALQKLFEPIMPVRLGLRYINHIDALQVSDELGRAVDWSELVSSAFITPPSGLVHSDARFTAQVNAPRDPGALTVQYGLVTDPQGKLGFRLDIDRYVEGAFQLVETERLLPDFAADIYSVFCAASAPTLLEWMGEKP
ncbi:MAG: TIGR04255 family protein [Polyangiaceae bacterium]|nr:TIGR04255 family protein [Polyangiaceae bacterium]